MSFSGVDDTMVQTVHARQMYNPADLRFRARFVDIFPWTGSLGACITDYGPVANDSVPISALAVASTLQTGDELKIIVFGEDALSGIYQISPSGTITAKTVIHPLIYMDAGRPRLTELR